MEHNQEKIIRDKIRQAEELPAVWDRTLVKDRIGSTNHSVRASYYVAASVMLVMSLAFIVWRWSYQMELQVRMSEVQLEIEKLAASNTMIPQNQLAVVDCPPDPQFTQPQVHADPAPPTVVTIVRVDTIRIPAPANPEPVIGPMKTEVAVVPIGASPQPEAIVGRTVVNDSKTRDKKFRLFLFRGDEPEPIKEPAFEPIAINNKTN